MKIILILASAIIAISAIDIPAITGTIPPAIDCPDEWCQGKADGNHEIYYHPNYFVQCLGGKAYCQACWPLSLTFSGKCNQCLYSRKDSCITTKKWEPVTTFECPDKCPHYGPTFSGNIADPYQPRQYVACWMGVTVGCVACPSQLEFNEKENACLFQGKYITAPTKA